MTTLSETLRFQLDEALIESCNHRTAITKAIDLIESGRTQAALDCLHSAIAPQPVPTWSNEQ